MCKVSNTMIYYSFNNVICSKGMTAMDDKSAKTASIFCNVVTFIKLSFLNTKIMTAKRAIISSESYARMRSHKCSNCSGGKCPLNAFINHLKTTRTLKTKQLWNSDSSYHYPQHNILKVLNRILHNKCSFAVPWCNIFCSNTQHFF